MRIFLNDDKKPKIKCNKCKKVIKGHIFTKFSNNLCADCFSKEFQKRLKENKV